MTKHVPRLASDTATERLWHEVWRDPATRLKFVVPRWSGDTQRLLEEVASAPDRATAEVIVQQFGFSAVPDREQLEADVPDLINELPE